MLSKVTKRVRRRSILASDVATPTLPETRRESVQVAPDLVRWGNFTDPFPSVAMGGYIRYYSMKKPDSAASPAYSPALSHFPESSPSHEIPRKSPLFFSSPPKHCLTIIHETSVESMTPGRPQNLVISTRASLRRRRRTLLRTPSIERDFAVNLRHVFVSNNNMSTSSVGASLSHGSTHSKSPSSSSSSDSHFDSGDRSEFPVTPSTSVDSGDEGGMLAQLYLEKAEEMDRGLNKAEQEAVSSGSRPESTASFSTALSDFGQDDVDNR